MGRKRTSMKKRHLWNTARPKRLAARRYARALVEEEIKGDPDQDPEVLAKSVEEEVYNEFGFTFDIGFVMLIIQFVLSLRK